MKIKSLLLPVIALCMTAASSQAATIVYGFDTAIAFGATLGAGSVVTTNDFSGDGVTVSNWTASSPAREIGVADGQVRAKKSEDNDTHQFTITLPSTTTIDFTTLFFNYGNVGGDTAPADILVSSDVVGGTFTNNPATHAAGPFSGSVTMDLTGFTGLTNRTVTFTLVDRAQGNNKNTTLYTFMDNVTLTGTVIPEPSTALLSGLGMLVLLRRRR